MEKSDTLGVPKAGGLFPLEPSLPPPISEDKEMNPRHNDRKPSPIAWAMLLISIAFCLYGIGYYL